MVAASASLLLPSTTGAPPPCGGWTGRPPRCMPWRAVSLLRPPADRDHAHGHRPASAARRAGGRRDRGRSLTEPLQGFGVAGEFRVEHAVQQIALAGPLDVVTD